jgi:hypothetical protein
MASARQSTKAFKRVATTIILMIWLGSLIYDKTSVSFYPLKSSSF